MGTCEEMDRITCLWSKYLKECKRFGGNFEFEIKG